MYSIIGTAGGLVAYPKRAGERREKEKKRDKYLPDTHMISVCTLAMMLRVIM